jgi:hypothetical protein
MSYNRLNGKCLGILLQRSVAMVLFLYWRRRFYKAASIKETIWISLQCFFSLNVHTNPMWLVLIFSFFNYQKTWAGTTHNLWVGLSGNIWMCSHLVPLSDGRRVSLKWAWRRPSSLCHEVSIRSPLSWLCATFKFIKQTWCWSLWFHKDYQRSTLSVISQIIPQFI